MSRGFASPITIKDAIDQIVDRTFLLPAIQRKFVWSSEQIEMLFDSIMRGYPINSFMLWEVKEPKVKNEFKFYEFLTSYRQLFREDNTDFDTKSHKDFKAIIDGQQRLTSLYIGLKGSYAYKLPRKWWYDNEENIPTRFLYLNLSTALPDENERQMLYDFQFLTDTEFQEASKRAVWFRVNDILKFPNSNDLDRYIDAQSWSGQGVDFMKDSIRMLRRVIFDEKLINYYLETTQEIDIVLDIFIRTNSGGEPLSFSDLLMSITTANWQTDARKEIPDVVKKVLEIGQPGFLISKDFILKTCLVLLNDNIKFQVKNFDHQSVLLFEQNWARIKKSILETFRLISDLGFNNHSLRAKNAAIPIIYYIYHAGIESTINNPLRHQEDKQKIRKWLCLALLKGVFGSQSDTVLQGVRKVIKTALSSSNAFPLDKIKEEFQSNVSKNLSFDDTVIDSLLLTQKDAPECFPILSLLYAHLNFGNQVYHKDHLHPASYFEKLQKSDFVTETEYYYYKDPANWNSILNLQLLNSVLNQSKLDMPLDKWVEENKVDRSSQLIPTTSLAVSDFKAFLENRRQLLHQLFKRITY